MINLLPADSKWAVPQESAAVAEQGLRYHHLPVVWEAPSADDFARFCALMQAESGRRVFVHCAVNKRVSVFVFLVAYCAWAWPARWRSAICWRCGNRMRCGAGSLKR